MAKLIDLEIKSEISEIQGDSFNISEGYTKNLDDIRKDIKLKIENLNGKLNKFQFKENMLDNLISETNTELQNLKENEFTKRGQKQSILLKQLEALSVLHDTIMKYEDMIQKYNKTLIDIENNKLNSFIKLENLKKEEEMVDDDLSSVLMGLQHLLSAGNNDQAAPQNELMLEIENELKDQNYK